MEELLQVDIAKMSFTIFRVKKAFVYATHTYLSMNQLLIVRRFRNLINICLENQLLTY